MIDPIKTSSFGGNWIIISYHINFCRTFFCYFCLSSIASVVGFDCRCDGCSPTNGYPSAGGVFECNIALGNFDERSGAVGRSVGRGYTDCTATDHPFPESVVGVALFGLVCGWSIFSCRRGDLILTS